MIQKGHFTLYIKDRIVFPLTAYVFPRISTLIFRTSQTLRINWDKLYSKVWITTTINLKNTFTVIKGLLKGIMRFNTAQTLKLTYALKSRDKAYTLIKIESMFKTHPVMRAKLPGFKTSQILKIFPDALVGVFRLLGEFDPMTLGDLDDETLRDMDFREVN